jgi:hypothetical protein
VPRRGLPRERKEIKGPEYKVDFSPPPRAEVKKMRVNTSIPPYIFIS